VVLKTRFFRIHRFFAADHHTTNAQTNTRLSTHPSSETDTIDSFETAVDYEQTQVSLARIVIS
jgi:hypothetical protein